MSIKNIHVRLHSRLDRRIFCRPCFFLVRSLLLFSMISCCSSSSRSTFEHARRLQTLVPRQRFIHDAAFQQSQIKSNLRNKKSFFRSIGRWSDNHKCLSSGRQYYSTTLTHPNNIETIKSQEILFQSSSDVPREIFDSNVASEFELPSFTEEENRLLATGQRVQRQTRNRNAGSGLVAVDVQADPSTVFEVLQRYSAYADMIDTVREARILDVIGPKTKAEFLLSRFKIRVRVVLTTQPEQYKLQFELDPSCTSAGKSILKEARGEWFIESSPSFRPGFCRVYLTASLTVNSFVPGFLVDYAAARALPRATSWLKPLCERVQRTRDREKARREIKNAAILKNQQG